MKNIPMFTTASGVASLILEEIPYKKIAYIKIQTSLTPNVLIGECVDFCRAVGAEQIYASGHDCLNKYPLHTKMIRMECKKAQLIPGKLDVRPVDTASVQQWCDIYNGRMRDVSNAATLTADKIRIDDQNCYFIYMGTQIVGIGKLDNNKIDAIASVAPGQGEEIMRSLCDKINAEIVAVEVASNNTPAVNLYNKLGFSEVEVLSTWHRVF